LSIGFESQEEFITLARAFEDVGVTAYAGAAPLLQNKANVAVAARILAAEAQHAGNIRLHAELYKVPMTPVDPADIIPPPSGTRFFSLESSALAIARTPGQVLQIVYGGPNKTSGAFFPNGVNGTVRMSEAPPPAPPLAPAPKA
jgi:hypothetical protein